MFRVFVVDDEEIIRTGIRNTLEKTGGRFLFTGEAPDGEMALPVLLELKPDILVTDVRMPFMDGLELAALVRKSMPWVRIIFLSGHDEFEYAQRAVSLQADAYILNPVDSRKLIEVLDRTADRIVEEQRMLRTAAQYTRRSEGERDVLRSHFLSELLAGGLSTAQAIDGGREWGVPLSARCYVVCQAECSTDSAGRQQVRAVVDHLLAGQEDVVWFFEGSDRLVWMILGDEESSACDRAYEIAQSIRHELRRVVEIDCRIGIGGAVDRLSGLPQSCQQARQAVEWLRSLPGGIAGHGDLSAPPEEGRRFDFRANMPLVEKLRHARQEDIPELIDIYFGGVKEDDLQSVLYRYYLLMDLVVTAARLDNADQDWKKDPQQVLHAAGSRESTLQYAEDTLRQVIGRRAVNGNVRYAAEIRRAQAYIAAHYSEEGLSLHTVAAEAGFSPNHFSTVFSQETGETFVEYLTRVRIDAAKEKLRSGRERMSDIAFDVGYHDPNYFSYIFKKRTGLSPRDFRAACGADMEKIPEENKEIKGHTDSGKIL